MKFPLGLILQCPTGFGLCVFIFIHFYANFDFFFDFFCDLLAIQQRVVQPPYVGIFNSFSPVIDIHSYCIAVRKDAWNYFNFLNLPRLDLWPRMSSVLEKVTCALEKKVKFIVLG